MSLLLHALCVRPQQPANAAVLFENSERQDPLGG